jgi:hypothetical protein
LPPYPSNPPTKRPLVSLQTQGRGFGVGVVVATQHPMSLDYRALGSSGLWWIGRLQTDADRARVVNGLETSMNASFARGRNGKTGVELARTIGRLAPRWFVMRDNYVEDGTMLASPRWAMSFMKGPMTGSEIRRARGMFAHEAARPSDTLRRMRMRMISQEGT